MVFTVIVILTDGERIVIKRCKNFLAVMAYLDEVYQEKITAVIVWETK